VRSMSGAGGGPSVATTTGSVEIAL
jgi:hypothetical protein